MKAKTLAEKISKNETTPQEQAALADAVKALAEQINAIDDAVKRIEAGPLRKRAILLLLKDSSGLSMEAVDSVLKAMASLRQNYVK